MGRHIVHDGNGFSVWLVPVLLLFLLTGCSSGSDEAEPINGGTENTSPVLELYVFSPERPVLTRANTGPVDPISEAESKITSLHIWVFITKPENDGEQLGYIDFSADDIADFTTNGGGKYRIMVSDQFARNKDNVDVFVLANVNGGEYGLPANLEEATDAQLKAAAMAHENSSDPFGVTTVTTVDALPANGIPMSGVLLNTPVEGNAPVLHIGSDPKKTAIVHMARTVSKMRFVFCQTSGMEGVVAITGVTINEGMIPKQEYLFLEQDYDGRTSHVGTEYENACALPGMAIANSEIPAIADPSKYSYSGQTGQEYEDLINEGLRSDPSAEPPKVAELVGKGPFYFRESDKAITGKVSYTVNGVAKPDASFSMGADGDFSRNHTWIVYVSYSASLLDVLSVDVESWSKEYNSEWEFYNW